MPVVLLVLSTVGTVAMLWVGGNIVLHGLEATHLWAWPDETAQHLAEGAARAVPPFAREGTAWLTAALFHAVAGLILGLGLVPVVTRLAAPLWQAARGTRADTER